VIAPSLFALFALTSAYPEGSVPVEPYVGMSVQPYSQKRSDGTTNRSRHTYVITVAAPIVLKRYPSDDYDMRLKLMMVPEFHLNNYLVMANLGFGPQWSVPFRAYRSVPAALVFDWITGAHFGAVYNIDNLTVQEGAAYRNNMRYSYAFHTGFGIAPEFNMFDRMGFRIRLHTQAYLGYMAPYTFRTSFSQYVGLAVGATAQFTF